jgi:hypothetical protein
MVEQVQQESIYDATNVSLRGFCWYTFNTKSYHFYNQQACL